MSDPGNNLPPDHWQRVKEVFGAALGRAPADRAAYLDQTCGTEEAVRREVESLLAAHQSSDTFLNTPATAEAIQRPHHIGIVEGQALGPYRILRTIGRGGMATVYLARDERHRRSVALKVLHPDLAHALGPERFLREIEVVANLTHPHILPLHDSGETSGLLFYVMPYVEGESLRDRLRRETQLPVQDALQIAREVADALAYAHGQGVIHRDIKPENIMLFGGHALVADFGIARVLGQAHLTETGMAIGTVAYMSPEQASAAGHLDGRSDVYSLACVVYEILAGEPPYTGPTAQSIIVKRLSDPVPSVRRLRPTVPRMVDEALIRALAPIPADRTATATEFAATLTASPGALAPPHDSAAATPRQTGRRWPVLIPALLALLVFLGIQLRPRAKVALDSDLLAVAPFEVLGPELKVWQEGLVDVLSRNFDGVGTLRTVPPTVVVRRFGGRTDRATALELGHRTGANLVLYGTVLGAGDSARISTTLLDVGRGRVLAETEVRGSASRMDRLADSLTVRVLRDLGRTRPVGAVRSMSFSSTSLPALRAFLQGERFYRRGEWDSSQAYYERAAGLDSSFALAFHRMGQVVGWQRSTGDSLAITYSLRAGALNHGLAPRESLLVREDSLVAAAFNVESDSAYYRLVGELLRVATEFTGRYRLDPEGWYLLGEVRHHLGAPFGVTPRQILAAFDRSIALDSAFAPAYLHNVDVTLNLDEPNEARRYIRAYLALDPKDFHADAIRALALLDTSSHRAGSLQRIVDGFPEEPLDAMLPALWRLPDSDEAAVKLFRHLGATSGSKYADPRSRRYTAGVLAYRGHLREAYALTSSGNALIFAPANALGLVPKDTAKAIFGAWLRQREPRAVLALGWWVSEGDTGSLRRFVRWQSEPMPAGSDRFDRNLRRFSAIAGRAYLGLARRDTAEALREFARLPDSSYVETLCLAALLEKAELSMLSGNYGVAAAVLSLEPAWPDRSPVPIEVFWILARARVAEHLKDRPQALRSYRLVADAWLHADPELRPYAAEARAAIQRLTAEPR
jgi:serine/threonine protein kinase/tetratricopeptide (TPR) repeat protein